MVRDAMGRPLRDLRISVTDRCNFRCPYCMPRELFGPDHAFLPRQELLDYDEIGRVVHAFAALGVTKVRLTGGEPLLRRDLATLVGIVAATPGVCDVALTTNGSLLAAQARDLAAAGLTRVTVSLDSLRSDAFQQMADTRTRLEAVLEGIEAARQAGLGPVKLNTVLRRGRNDEDLLPLVDFARDGGHVLRVIEYMDVGETNGWVPDDVVPAAEVLQRVNAVHPLEPVGRTARGEVAERYRYLDGGGELGLITSVSKPFCGDCIRARLTAVGELFTCLFASSGTDLRAVLRSGADDDALRAAVAGRWKARDDRYSELRGTGEAADQPRAEMSFLGG